MKTKTLKKAMCLMLLALGVMAFQPAAHAVPMQLMLQDQINGDTVVVNSAADGLVSFFGPVGSWFINMTGGITFPNLGSLASPIMDLSSVDISSPGLPVPDTLNPDDPRATLLIEVSAVGFTGLNGWGLFAGGTTNGGVLFDARCDPSNGFFGGDPIFPISRFFGSTSYSNPPIAFSGTSAGTIEDTAFGTPYSLTIAALINHYGTAASATSFNAELTQAPEPGSLILLGCGLIGLLGLRRITV